jgi:hypothetical protein
MPTAFQLPMLTLSQLAAACVIHCHTEVHVHAISRLSLTESACDELQLLLPVKYQQSYTELHTQTSCT